MSSKILIIDDDPKLLESLAEVLREEGYQVGTSVTGEEGLSALKRENFDLVLLDIRLPGMDGEVVMREIHNYHLGTEMIIISGYGSLESAITAIRLGVKDYFIKPYQVEDLLKAVYQALTEKETRVRKEVLINQLASSLEQLRDLEGIRGKDLPSRRVLTLPGGVMVDLERREIWRGNERVGLTPTESNLLGIFLENRGRVLSHKELVLLVQGIQVEEDEAPEILRPMVSRLRKKLAIFPATNHWIGNVRGKGYAFDPN
jgi:DNA-binding response OmpR family regulator